MLLMDTLTDLSQYYIIKKFQHGWLVGSLTDSSSLFVTRSELVRMGYESEPADITLSSTPPAIPTVIMVPTGREKRSKSYSK